MLEIIKTISLSQDYLLLSDNWDEEGALPLNIKAYTNGLETIFKIINNIGITVAPFITLCRDGSIDILYRKNGSKLLINSSSRRISWYGYKSIIDGEYMAEIKGNTFLDMVLYDFVKNNLLKI